MRTIVEYCLVSADGIVLDDPFPFGDYLDDGYLRDRAALFDAAEASLWGRTTYERFAARWAGSDATPAYVKRLAALPKYVVSSMLARTEWHDTTIVRGDFLAEVTRLKRQDGGPLLVLGHGMLAETLLNRRLIDQLILTLHPVFVGGGEPLFRNGQATRWKLVASTAYSQLVRVVYEPAT